MGAFTKYAGIKEHGYITINGLNYGSSLWFIHESDKLNTICNITEYPGDNTADNNPENGCAPSLLGRISKQKKYKERYDKVRAFFKEYLEQSSGDPASFVHKRLRNQTVKFREDCSLKDIEDFIITHLFKSTGRGSSRKEEKENQIKFDSELYEYIQRTIATSEHTMIGAARRQLV